MKRATDLEMVCLLKRRSWRNPSAAMLETVSYTLPVGFEPPCISLPRQQTAIVQDTDGTAQICHDAPLPVPEAHMIIVKVVAVSLNPCDWKMPAKFPAAGARIGCDFTGTVVAIGPEARQGHLQIGDRVCGGVHGSNPIDLPSGAFAQYVAAFANLTLKLPEAVSWQSGAVLGATALSTLSIVIHHSLDLEGTLEKPLEPGSKQSPYVLVYGASTSTGTLALQLLRM